MARCPACAVHLALANSLSSYPSSSSSTVTSMSCGHGVMLHVADETLSTCHAQLLVAASFPTAHSRVLSASAHSDRTQT